MHLLGISLLLVYLLYANLARNLAHSDYYDYYEEQMYEPVSLNRNDQSWIGVNLVASEGTQQQPAAPTLSVSVGPPEGFIPVITPIWQTYNSS